MDATYFSSACMADPASNLFLQVGCYRSHSLSMSALWAYRGVIQSCITVLSVLVQRSHAVFGVLTCSIFVPGGSESDRVSAVLVSRLPYLG